MAKPIKATPKLDEKNTVRLLEELKKNEGKTISFNLDVKVKDFERKMALDGPDQKK